MNQTTEKIQMILPAQYKYLNVLAASIGAMLEHAPDLDEPELVTYNVQLAVQEVCTNIIEHSYSDLTEGIIRVTMTLEDAPARLCITLRDSGESFNMGAVSHPSLHKPQIHGYGLFLVHQLMDDVMYQPEPKNNRWHLVKYLANNRLPLAGKVLNVSEQA